MGHRVLSSRVRAGLTAFVAAIAVLSWSAVSAQAQTAGPKVLVFHKTTGAPHQSTAEGVKAIQEIGAANGFTVEATTDAEAHFTANKLAEYAAVVFLSTNGDVLTSEQEAAFQAYYRGGGGFVGIHDAARLEPNASWFTSLVGSRPNAGSPTAVQEAIVEVQDKAHLAGRGLPTEWQRSDEWFNWQPSPAGNVHVIANLRERSYANKGTGANGWQHPITWCRDFDGGRSFYTGMGHTVESYAEADFRSHLKGGILWAAGLIRGNCKATISTSYTAERLTAPNAFQGDTPATQLNQIGEPHGLSIAEDGRVFYIGRADKGSSAPIDSWTDPNGFRGWGTVHVWDPSKPAGQRVKLVGTLDVFGDSVGGSELQKKEEGLIGIALDPNFETNKHIWLHYTPYEKVDKITRIATRRISRFTYDEANARLDLASEKPILEWTYQAHSCCHMGGDMDFDKDGNLYILTGDTNSSGSTSGYSGNFVPNVFPGGLPFNDARRTSGNTNDLNGKIIRIKPRPNPGATPGAGSTYDIPAGNLFGPGGKYPDVDPEKVREEVWVMGVRNPTRLWIDRETGWAMTGWVGPDASNPNAQLGPAKYESLAAIPEAANYGWPFCMGDKQPYRDRLNDGTVSNGTPGNPTGWYDCDKPVNESPYNTGLVNLPPVTPVNMWYSPGGGGPKFPIDPATGRPDYGKTPEYTQPYLPTGGGQATMAGPFYRYDADSKSATKFPEFWDKKWFIGDHSRGAVQRAVLLDEDTVNGHKAPKVAVDTSGIVGKTGAQMMGMEFGPDGNLYVLDYGGGFFTVTSRSSLWRVSYTGGEATPHAVAKGQPIGEFKVRFASGGSGGVSYRWDFGDGQSSTQANPTHTYAEAKRYVAKLTVTYADGGTDVTEVPVDVLAAPDNAKPVTTASLAPATPGAGGTYMRPVTVTLGASDTGGSGLDRTEYRINGGDWQRYIGPITRSQPDVYTIEYRSIDMTGNEEDTKTIGFTIAVPQNCPTNLNDEFTGTSLGDKWEVLRSDPATLSISGGGLTLSTNPPSDMIGGTATAKNVLLQPAPQGSWVISTKVNVSQLAEEGAQAGLILWNAEGTNRNTFAKITYINKGATRQFEWVSTRPNNAGNGHTQTISPGPSFATSPSDVWLRVSHNGGGTYVAEGSFDGEQWHQIAQPFSNVGSPDTLKFGLKISDNGGDSRPATFDYFRVDCSDRVAPVSSAAVGPIAPDGERGYYKTSPTVTLSATDGPLGSIGKIEYRINGGETKTYTAPFTITEPGNHVVEYFATDGAPEPNREQVKSFGIRVDGAAPETKAAFDRSAGANGPVKVSLATEDTTGSGSMLTEYRVDGGPWKTYAFKNEQVLFDGTQASLLQWAQAPSGRFDLLTDGSGGITPVGGLGMLWYPHEQFGDFRLKLQFREGRADSGYSNGGVFVRFPDPRTPLAERADQCAKTGSAATSQAWVAIYCGHEIQIYDGPTGEARKTGSIYTFDNNNINQIGTPKPRGEWEDYEVEVIGQTYRIFRNGQLINTYENTPDKVSDRGGDPPASQRQFAQGFIGLQNHGGADTTHYRNVRVQDLSENALSRNPTGAFEVSGVGPHTIEFRSVDAAGNREAKQTVEFEIGSPTVPGPQPNPGAGGQNPPASGGGQVDPPASPPLVDTPASFKLGRVAARLGRSAFARSGVRVPVRCEGAMAGTAKLSVTRKVSRQLKLGRTALRTVNVRCWGEHSTSVRLKPGKALMRKLTTGRKGPRTVKLQVQLRLEDFGKPAQTITRTITLRRR